MPFSWHNWNIEKAWTSGKSLLGQSMNNHTARMSCWTALGTVTQLAGECTTFRGTFNWQVLINVLECFVSCFYLELPCRQSIVRRQWKQLMWEHWTVRTYSVEVFYSSKDKALSPSFFYLVYNILSKHHVLLKDKRISTPLLYLAWNSSTWILKYPDI